MKSFLNTIAMVTAVLVTGCASNTQFVPVTQGPNGQTVYTQSTLFENQHIDRHGRVVTKSFKPGCSMYEHSNAIELCISKPTQEEQLKAAARAARQLQGAQSPNNAFFIEQDIKNAKLAVEMKEAEKRFFANR